MRVCPTIGIQLSELSQSVNIKRTYNRTHNKTLIKIYYIITYLLP